ncbi:MAG: hypothetical protein GF330_09120 [Candidatus Eisenbacteria bacterium]|nr:hypothetical protein [Candidatus Eisenbacteria bacterium]
MPAAWAEAFAQLADDPQLREMSAADATHRIFLHQAALTGAVLRRLAPSEMRELSPAYNYPILFEEVYGGTRVYDSIEEVTTIRCMAVAEGRDVRYRGRLRGPADRLAWLDEHLP